MSTESIKPASVAMPSQGVGDCAGAPGVPALLEAAPIGPAEAHVLEADSSAPVYSPSLQAAVDALALVPGKLQSLAGKGMAIAAEKPGEFLAWIASCATAGFAGFPGAAELASSYAGLSPDDDAVKRLIDDQVAFIRQRVSINLAGTGSVYASIFADMASPWLLKMRLVLAVAALSGNDPAAAETRSLAYACLCGREAENVLASAGLAYDAALRRFTAPDLGTADRAIGTVVSKQFAARQTAKGAVRFGVQGIARVFRRMPLLDVIETVSDRIYEHVDVAELIDVSDAACRVFARRSVGSATV